MAAILLLFSAVSCTETFDPGVDNHPVAVLNSIAMPDSSLTVSLTRSWPFGGETPDRKTVTLPSATVTVTVNGTRTHTLTYDRETLLYRTDFAPSPGDRLEISAVDPVYGRVSGSTVVPLPPVVDDLKVSTSVEKDPDHIIVGSDGELVLDYVFLSRYSLTFTDPADQDNYYMIAGERINVKGEPIFDEHVSVLDIIFDYDWADLLMFNDKTVNGSTYTLRFKTSYSILEAWIQWSNAVHWEHELPVFTDSVRFYSISREYYAYLVSIYQKYGGFNAELENAGMAEPTAVYSNIEGGTGIVCSQTPVVYVFDITDEIVALFPESKE